MKKSRQRRLRRRERMDRERRARRKRRDHEMTAALVKHIQSVLAEERAKGVPEVVVQRRELLATLYAAHEVATQSPHTEEFIIINMTRIIRGQPLLQKRQATERPPRRDVVDRIRPRRGPP